MLLILIATIESCQKNEYYTGNQNMVAGNADMYPANTAHPYLMYVDECNPKLMPDGTLEREIEIPNGADVIILHDNGTKRVRETKEGIFLDLRKDCDPNSYTQANSYAYPPQNGAYPPQNGAYPPQNGAYPAQNVVCYPKTATGLEKIPVPTDEAVDTSEDPGSISVKGQPTIIKRSNNPLQECHSAAESPLQILPPTVAQRQPTPQEIAYQNYQQQVYQQQLYQNQLYQQQVAYQNQIAQQENQKKCIETQKEKKDAVDRINQATDDLKMLGYNDEMCGNPTQNLTCK